MPEKRLGVTDSQYLETLIVEVLEEDCEACLELPMNHAPPFGYCRTHMMRTIHLLDQEGIDSFTKEWGNCD